MTGFFERERERERDLNLRLNLNLDLSSFWNLTKHSGNILSTKFKPPFLVLSIFAISVTPSWTWTRPVLLLLIQYCFFQPLSGCLTGQTWIPSNHGVVNWKTKWTPFDNQVVPTDSIQSLSGWLKNQVKPINCSDYYYHIIPPSNVT